VDPTQHPHGVVAVGDSFMNGYGLPLAGVTCSSWASWLTWGLTGCLTQHAVNGATCEQALRDQIPLLAGHRYRLGTIWLGANDIARLDAPAVANQLSAVCVAVAGVCEYAAIATLPSSLTSSGSTQRTHADGRRRLNDLIREVAGTSGVVLVELEDALSGPWSMAPDHEHPTALGQLEAANCAAHALSTAGLAFERHLPRPDLRQPTASEQRLYRPGRRSRLRNRLPRGPGADA
jgi:hypothetical protein